MKSFLRALTLVTALLSVFSTTAQTTLFEYPIAPDTCSTMESRCNYSVQHFWDKCELTKPFDASSDSLLVEAMVTYFEIMRAGANINLSLASVRNLMFKSQVNHDNFLKLAAIAEYVLFYHDNDVIDDLYIAFAKSVVDATWAKKEIRNHYADQVKRLEVSKLGQPLLDFEYTSISGARRHLTDNRADSVRLYVVMFSDKDSGSSIERMRLNADVRFEEAVKTGFIKVINIMVTDVPKQWDTDSQNYASVWEVGANKDLSAKLDMRIIPCLYILDEDFKVIAKNKTVDFMKSMLQR